MLHNLIEKATHKWETMTRKQKFGFGAALVVLAIVAVNSNNDPQYRNRGYPPTPVAAIPNFGMSGNGYIMPMSGNGYTMPTPVMPAPSANELAAQMNSSTNARIHQFNRTQQDFEDIMTDTPYVHLH
jgi:hypothetical protein